MKDINIGIIGCGLLGNIHVMALNTIIEQGYFDGQANISITALCDSNQEHLTEYNEQFELKNVFTNYHDLIKCPEVNTVYIVTPTYAHAEIFRAAAAAHKQIFMEKPVTDPVGEIDTLIQARDKAGIIAQVGLILRYDPVCWFIRQMINKPENKQKWGKLQNVIFRDSQDKPYTGTGSHPSTWRKDPAQAFHGCLFEHSIHDIDIMRYWLGEITEVYAKVKFIAGIPPIEDSVCACFELANGASANLTSLWHNVAFDQRDFELFWENAYMNMIFEGISVTLTLQEKGNKKETFKSKDMDLALRASMGIDKYPSFWLGGYGYEDIAFLQTLIAGRPASPGLEDAKRAHQIVDACYRSSKQNSVLRI